MGLHHCFSLLPSAALFIVTTTCQEEHPGKADSHSREAAAPRPGDRRTKKSSLTSSYLIQGAAAGHHQSLRARPKGDKRPEATLGTAAIRAILKQNSAPPNILNGCGFPPNDLIFQSPLPEFLDGGNGRDGGDGGVEGMEEMEGMEGMEEKSEEALESREGIISSSKLRSRCAFQWTKTESQSNVSCNKELSPSPDCGPPQFGSWLPPAVTYTPLCSMFICPELIVVLPKLCRVVT